MANASPLTSAFAVVSRTWRTVSSHFRGEFRWIGHNRDRGEYTNLGISVWCRLELHRCIRSRGDARSRSRPREITAKRRPFATSPRVRLLSVVLGTGAMYGVSCQQFSSSRLKRASHVTRCLSGAGSQQCPRGLCVRVLVIGAGQMALTTSSAAPSSTRTRRPGRCAIARLEPNTDLAHGLELVGSWWKRGHATR